METTHPGPEDRQDPPALQGLCDDLASAGQQLCSTLVHARDFGWVEAAFSTFLGSRPIAVARTLTGADAVRPRAALRRSLSPLYDHARTWQHAREKPYGYPGDFSILELVYDRLAHPETRDAWAAFVDRWSLETELPRAVRARKTVLRAWLADWLHRQSPHAPPVHILSIASGSAREIRELGDSALARVAVTLLDADERSLTYAAGALRTRAIAPDLVTIASDAVHGGPELVRVAERGPFDVVYSFGLFDYLPDNLLHECISRFLPMLAPQGQFVFCLKDCRFYDSWFYDWLLHWRFVPRTSDDGLALARRAGLQVDSVMILEGRAIAIFVCTRSPNWVA